MTLTGTEFVDARSEETEEGVLQYEEELPMKVGDVKGSILARGPDDAGSSERERGQTFGEQVAEIYPGVEHTDADKEHDAPQTIQHDDMVERVVRTIQRLIATSELTPDAIADTLGGTLRVRSGGEYRVDYEVTVELLPPMWRANVSHGPKSGWTYVEIELAEGHSIPLDAVADAFQDHLFTFRPATTVHPRIGHRFNTSSRCPWENSDSSSPTSGKSTCCAPSTSRTSPPCGGEKTQVPCENSATGPERRSENLLYQIIRGSAQSIADTVDASRGQS